MTLKSVGRRTGGNDMKDEDSGSKDSNGKHVRSIAKRKLYRRRWMRMNQRLSFFINKLFLKYNYHEIEINV